MTPRPGMSKLGLTADVSGPCPVAMRVRLDAIWPGREHERMMMVEGITIAQIDLLSTGVVCSGTAQARLE